jgi:hypothetical protein
MRSRSCLALIIATLVSGSRSAAPISTAGPRLWMGASAAMARKGLDQVFEKLVYPILQRNCADCHSAGPQDPSTNYVLTGNAGQDRAMVVALVTPGDPADSRLLDASHQRQSRRWPALCHG